MKLFIKAGGIRKPVGQHQVTSKTGKTFSRGKGGLKQKPVVAPRPAPKPDATPAPKAQPKMVVSSSKKPSSPLVAGIAGIGKKLADFVAKMIENTDPIETVIDELSKDKGFKQLGLSRERLKAAAKIGKEAKVKEPKLMRWQAKQVSKIEKDAHGARDKLAKIKKDLDAIDKLPESTHRDTLRSRIDLDMKDLQNNEFAKIAESYVTLSAGSTEHKDVQRATMAINELETQFADVQGQVAGVSTGKPMAPKTSGTQSRPQASQSGKMQQTMNQPQQTPEQAVQSKKLADDTNKAIELHGRQEARLKENRLKLELDDVKDPFIRDNMKEDIKHARLTHTAGKEAADAYWVTHVIPARKIRLKLQQEKLKEKMSKKYGIKVKGKKNRGEHLVVGTEPAMKSQPIMGVVVNGD